MRKLLSVIVLLLSVVSVQGAVKVDIGTFTGGRVVEKSQQETGDGGSVIVTITVTPDAGYEISKTDIQVSATLPADHSLSRAPTIAMMLELQGDDPKDLSQPRDYSFTVEAGFGAWVHTAEFHRRDVSVIQPDTYRICFVSQQSRWYLWPSVTSDKDGHPYLTTYNGISAPALDYPSGGVSYSAFDEQYSLWQITPVNVGEQTYYQLFNIGFRQYVVWSSAEGQKVVHLEASPSDVTHTYFRFDRTADGYLITPSAAAKGTTLNSRYGDKPFLSSSGRANASSGYPNGEPDSAGEGGLIQTYAATPVWTIERAEGYESITFQNTSTEGNENEERAAVYVPAIDLALPDGLKAYMVTGVDLFRGLVLLQEVSYMPQAVPLLLLAEGDMPGFALTPKGNDTAPLSDEEIQVNLLRIGSSISQPTPFEDYVFFRGSFVLVGGGRLADGKVFLDLNGETAKARRPLGIRGSSASTSIISLRQVPTDSAKGWITLGGQRLAGKPSKPGIYLHDGKKQAVR